LAEAALETSAAREIALLKDSSVPALGIIEVLVRIVAAEEYFTG